MAKSKHRERQGFSFTGLAIRFGLALVLVLVTYNPTSYSYVNWFWDALSASSVGAVHVFSGIVLTIGWAMLLHGTFNALGGFGLCLGAALFAALVWLLFDVGLLSGTGIAFYTWIGLVCLAALLAIGLSWSHIWRRLTGQVAVDEVED